MTTHFERVKVTKERLRQGQGRSGIVTISLFRAKVPGGWLIRSSAQPALCFYPDPKHLWLKPKPKKPSSRRIRMEE